MEPQPVITIQNLSFRYEEELALKKVSLSVHAGDFLALIGPNGSGKTTLLKMLLGILAPQQGTVSLYGDNPVSYPPKERAKRIAYVSQQPAANFPLTVFELVSLGRYPYSIRFAPAEGETAAVEEALAMTDSTQLRDRKFTSLSGGEKQKVLIARALAQSKGILLLDEPTVHLDLYHQMEILKTLKKLCAERRTTVVAVLHDVNLVSFFADQVVMLRGGKVYASGAVHQTMTEQNIEAVYGVAMTAKEDGRPGGRYFVPRDPLELK